MRIDEIIVEYKPGTPIDIKTLQAEFDEQYGDPRLPQHINLSKSQIVVVAKGIAQKTRETPGTAIRKATKLLYPNHNIDADVFIGTPNSPNRKDTTNDFVFKAKKSDDKDKKGPGRGQYTKYKDGSDRKSTPEPKWEPAKSDGSGTGAKIAKALNPLSDLDSTDLGTVATSALSKASAKFKNKDIFKRQPSKGRK